MRVFLGIVGMILFVGLAFGSIYFSVMAPNPPMMVGGIVVTVVILMVFLVLKKKKKSILR